MPEEVTYPCPGDRTAQELMTARMEAQLREKYREQERIAEEKVRRIVREEMQGTVPPSPDLCECGHGRAMHFDEDGDHKGPCLWQVHPAAPFCKCDMWRRKQAEDEFLGVPVSDWHAIKTEIDRRRGFDGSLSKRFGQLMQVFDASKSRSVVDVRALVEACEAFWPYLNGYVFNEQANRAEARALSLLKAARAALGGKEQR